MDEGAELRIINGVRTPWPRALLLATLALAAALPGIKAEAASAPKSKIDRVLAYYIPRRHVTDRLYLPRMRASYTPGRALDEAARTVGNTYFKSAVPFDAKSGARFNAVLVMHPKWDSKDGLSVLTIKYKLIDALGTTLFEGEHKDDVRTSNLILENRFFSVSLGVMKDIVSDESLLSKAAESKVEALPAAFDVKLLVDREKPVKTGTGFFINDHGQILTAAHVVHECPVVEVKVDGKSVDATPVAESAMLDLAVVAVGGSSPHAIPLRAGAAFDLGEGVIDVGFPLTGVLAGSANVTRGNISSREALAGSWGQFQFSAPVQPGSSGGPVVSETGELLGVTVGSLTAAGLIDRGILPQNVNFALDARYAAAFLDRNKIAYLAVARKATPDAHAATDMTLAAVVPIACYQ